MDQKTITAVIVEGTPQNHRHLVKLLQNHCREVVVTGVAETLEDAVALVKNTRPDLVFLAIKLPDGNGFGLLDQFDPVPFKVVFVTSYREYAYQAIKYHAVDFLLKPIKAHELVAAVCRVIRYPVDEQYRQRLDDVRHQYPDPEKIILADSNGFQIINASEIICLEANGNYTDLYLLGDRKLTFCRILKEFATLLKDHKFIKRTHRSYIVNLNHISSFSNEGIIKLNEGHKASLGDTFRDDFLSCFKFK